MWGRVYHAECITLSSYSGHQGCIVSGVCIVKSYPRAARNGTRWVHWRVSAIPLSSSAFCGRILWGHLWHFRERRMNWLKVCEMKRVPVAKEEQLNLIQVSLHLSFTRLQVICQSNSSKEEKKWICLSDQGASFIPLPYFFFMHSLSHHLHHSVNISSFLSPPTQNTLVIIMIATSSKSTRGSHNGVHSKLHTTSLYSYHCTLCSVHLCCILQLYKAKAKTEQPRAKGEGELSWFTQVKLQTVS